MLELATLETLGQQVGELELRRNLVLSHVTILHSLTSKVLPDVDVLQVGTLPTTDDVVRLFDARRVVLKHHRAVSLLHWQSHITQGVAEVNDFNGHFRCRIILRLRRG